MARSASHELYEQDFRREDICAHYDQDWYLGHEPRRNFEISDEDDGDGEWLELGQDVYAHYEQDHTLGQLSRWAGFRGVLCGAAGHVQRRFPSGACGAPERWPAEC